MGIDKHLILVTTLILCSTALGAQEFTKEEQKIIERGVEINLQNYKLRKERECKADAVERAIAIVDSMVRELGKNDRIDKVVKPPRPSKPNMPPVKTLPDSVNMGIIQKD